MWSSKPSIEHTPVITRVQLVYLIVKESSKEEIREIIRNTLKLILSLDVNTNLINFIGNGMVGSGEVLSGFLTEMRIETLKQTGDRSAPPPPSTSQPTQRCPQSSTPTQSSVLKTVLSMLTLWV